MTNPELNRALTELQGYSVKPAIANPKWYRMVNPKGQEFGAMMPTEKSAWDEYAFPYSTDPAASLEVQTVAIAKDADSYLSNLFDATSDPDKPVWTTKVVARMLTASPRERAEAAYITLSSKQ
jgi:hypothetical protein